LSHTPNLPFFALGLREEPRKKFSNRQNLRKFG
jgi:hypothetical protein